MINIKNLLNSEDLSRDDLYEIVDLANEIIKSPQDFAHICDGKILGTLFLSHRLGLGYHLNQPCKDWAGLL